MESAAANQKVISTIDYSVKPCETTLNSRHEVSLSIGRLQELTQKLNHIINEAIAIKLGLVDSHLNNIGYS